MLLGKSLRAEVKIADPYVGINTRYLRLECTDMNALCQSAHKIVPPQTQGFNEEINKLRD